MKHYDVICYDYREFSEFPEVSLYGVSASSYHNMLAKVHSYLKASIPHYADYERYIVIQSCECD